MKQLFFFRGELQNHKFRNMSCSLEVIERIRHTSLPDNGVPFCHA